ncbi:MAG: dihydrofolate reductase [Patescibacteria group bacterium]
MTEKTLNISIIAAVSDNNVIGRNGDLPWQVKADLDYFAELTSGHYVICGRKTHESILKRLGHSLKNRTTIIITNQKHYDVPENCVKSSSLVWVLHAIRMVKSKKKVFVIGGAKIFKIALPYVKRMYITRIHKIVDDADAFFPEYDKNEWRLVSQEHHCCDTIENKHDFTFEIWERKT